MKDVRKVNIKANDFYREIHIARGIGVLLVLAGHSFPDAELNLFLNDIARWGHDFLYSFHMALFFVISGFVMGNRYFIPRESIGRELVGKIKRLMIPYFFLSYLSLLPKILWNAYARNPVDTKTAWRILLGKSPNGSLWYIYTLFLLSIFIIMLAYVLRNMRDDIKIICLIVPAVLCLLSEFVWGNDVLSAIYLDRICRYSVYYMIGIIMWRYYEKVHKIFRIIPAVAAIALTVILSSPFISQKIPYLVTALIGTYGFLGVSFYISEKGQKDESFLCRCGDYSYDIYILSYYIQQTIRVVFYHRMGVGYIPAFFMELLFGFTFAVYFSKYFLRKSRLLKILLIGEWPKGGESER